jgi:hypothetical protein
VSSTRSRSRIVRSTKFGNRFRQVEVSGESRVGGGGPVMGSCCSSELALGAQDGTVSWQYQVDELLVASGAVTAAGVYDLDGHPWAYSTGFGEAMQPVTVREVSAVNALFADPSKLTPGATVRTRLWNATSRWLPL